MLATMSGCEFLPVCIHHQDIGRSNFYNSELLREPSAALGKGPEGIFLWKVGSRMLTPANISDIG